MNTDRADAFDKASRLAPQVSKSEAEAPPASPLESAITVEFDTGSLPVAQANASKFIELLRANLKTELDEDIQMTLLKNRIDLSTLSLKLLDRMLPTPISFQDGSIEYDYKGKHTYVQLSFITVSAIGGILKVGAIGTSEDAEKALSKVYECIFEAAEMKSQWADATGRIIAKGYSTCSVEYFDGGLDKLLSDNLASLFSPQSFQERDLISHLGVLPLNPETGKPYKGNHHAVVKLSELEIEVVRLDDLTGDRYRSTVRIRPKTKVDAGLGRYVFTSDLEYTKHMELVKSFKDALVKK